MRLSNRPRARVGASRVIIRALIREASRNVFSGTSRSVALCALWISVVGSLCVVEARAVRDAVESAAEWRSAGAAIVMIEAEGRVDGSACEVLNTLPNVRAAGALRMMASGLRPLSLPDLSVPTYEVSPSFPMVLQSRADGGPGVVLSEDAALMVSARTGDVLATADGSTRVSGEYPYPNDGRRSGYGFAALAPVASEGLFDACWVEAWPSSPALASAMRSVVRTTGDAQSEGFSTTQLNSSLGAQFTGEERFESRVTRWAPLVACTVLSALGIVLLRTRRVQLAAALHDGVARGALALMVAVETAAGLALGVSSCLAGLFAVASLGPPDAWASVLVVGLRVVGCGVLGTCTGTAIGFLMVRERLLFRYVKDR